LEPHEGIEELHYNVLIVALEFMEEHSGHGNREAEGIGSQEPSPSREAQGPACRHAQPDRRGTSDGRGVDEAAAEVRGEGGRGRKERAGKERREGKESWNLTSSSSYSSSPHEVHGSDGCPCFILPKKLTFTAVCNFSVVLVILVNLYTEIFSEVKVMSIGGSQLNQLNIVCC